MPQTLKVAGFCALLLAACAHQSTHEPRSSMSYLGGRAAQPNSWSSQQSVRTAPQPEVVRPTYAADARVRLAGRSAQPASWLEAPAAPPKQTQLASPGGRAGQPSSWPTHH